MTYLPENLIEDRFRRRPGGAVASGNERSLLKQLWLHPGISRSELTSRSDLTQQSTHRILDQLATRGIIKLGAAKSGLGSGQPSPMMKLNGDFAHSCGLSVNVDTLGICVMDFSGEVLAESDVALHGQGVEEALDEARQEIARLRLAKDLDPELCFGFGCAVAGYYVGGTRFNASLPLNDWSLIELGPLLSNFFGRPAWVHNGGSTGAVAEALFGVGRYISNFAYLSFNYGFGGGMVSNGELLVGGNGNAGEYGPIFRGSRPRPALEFLIKRLKEHGVEIRSITHLQCDFDPDWPGVAEWVDEVTPYYNTLIDAIVGVFDPQAIVFGGQVPPALAQLFIERTDPPETPRYGVPRPEARLLVSKLGGDAAALGAAAVPFKSEFY